MNIRALALVPEHALELVRRPVVTTSNLFRKILLLILITVKPKDWGTRNMMALMKYFPVEITYLRIFLPSFGCYTLKRLQCMME